MNHESSSHRYVAPLVCLLICFAGVLRTGASFSPQYTRVGTPDPATIRTVTEALVDEAAAETTTLLKDAGIDQVQWQQFDANAAVVLAGGIDNQPGQRGQDDNFDGVIDNAAELGAMRSDDQCVAPWDANYAAAKHQDHWINISRGAFVRSDDVDKTKPWRVVISGHSDGQPWTWVVVPPLN